MPLMDFMAFIDFMAFTFIAFMAFMACTGFMAFIACRAFMAFTGMGFLGFMAFTAIMAFMGSWPLWLAPWPWLGRRRWLARTDPKWLPVQGFTLATAMPLAWWLGGLTALLLA